MEREMDDDSESIITNERYNSISRIINDAVVKASPGSLTGSDRLIASSPTAGWASPFLPSSCGLYITSPFRR